MSVEASAPAAEKPVARRRVDRMWEAILTQRIVLLTVLIVIVVAWLMYMSANGYLSGDYDFDYMSASLIDAVPLALLGFAELVVIVSGRGGIDLSVGAMVSLVGMIFGFAYGKWGWSLLAAVVLAIVVGAVLGAINGFLVARIGFPALIATLATYFSVFGAGFIWNDSDYVTQPALRSLAGLKRIWFEVGATEQYYPVLHSAFWLQHQLWGDSTVAHHLVNVLLHFFSDTRWRRTFFVVDSKYHYTPGISTYGNE